jgi:hypothetical protein
MLIPASFTPALPLLDLPIFLHYTKQTAGITIKIIFSLIGGSLMHIAENEFV